MTLKELNNLRMDAAEGEFLRCCGSAAWASRMTAMRPFRDRAELSRAADTIWKEMSPSDWKEAFSRHPRIGDIESLAAKFGSTASWAEGEQSGVKTASLDVLRRLLDASRKYERAFGYEFIVNATGKSADLMLEILEQRLKNDANAELVVSAEEQRKITAVRLEKLLGTEGRAVNSKR